MKKSRKFFFERITEKIQKESQNESRNEEISWKILKRIPVIINKRVTESFSKAITQIIQLSVVI